MSMSVKMFADFGESKRKFEENMAEVSLLQRKIEMSQGDYDKANKEIADLDAKGRKLSKQTGPINEEMDALLEEIDRFKRTERNISSFRLLLDEDVDKEAVVLFKQGVLEVIDKKIFLDPTDHLEEFLKLLFELNQKDYFNEIRQWRANASGMDVQIKKEELLQQINSLTDESGMVVNEEDEEKVVGLRKEFAELRKKEEAQGANNPDLSIARIFTTSCLNGSQEEFYEKADALRDNISAIRSEIISTLIVKREELETRLAKKKNELQSIKDQRREIDEQITEIKSRPIVQEIATNRAKLQRKIEEMFHEFSIEGSYKNVDEAKSILESRMREYEEDGRRLEEENKKKIPTFQKIISYLQDGEVVEADKRKFTRDLFLRANVFGITCNSRERFREKDIKSSADYGLSEISLKNIGIDVVIIDEVSKSSFIDLLIPILYGKTVILVGDHRQLPPNYDLGKLREEDFDDLDSSEIDCEENRRFKELYETCFFKTLFEKTPDSYKTMLDRNTVAIPKSWMSLTSSIEAR